MGFRKVTFLRSSVTIWSNLSGEGITSIWNLFEVKALPTARQCHMRYYLDLGYLLTTVKIRYRHLIPAPVNRTSTMDNMSKQ